MNLILNLGKDIFSEPVPAPAKLTDAKDTDQAKSVEAQDPPANEPASPETSVPKIQRNLSSKDSDDAGPLKVPDSVHIRINPDNLKNYVRPPIYQKDRIYMHAPCWCEHWSWVSW
jgi:ATP-dependent Lon protease